MAELTPFSYRPGKSLIHQLDIRAKIALLIAFNLISLKVTPFSLILLSVPVVVMLFRVKIPILKTLQQIKYFLLLLLFVFLSRALFTEGEILMESMGLVITKEGLYEGLMFCARLSLILFGGIVFISTSNTMEIKAGIEWFLRPVPLVPEKRVSVMIGLMLRFIPLIFEKSAEISNAQKARAVENIKNPIRRLILFSIPLLIRTFQTADHLVLAMEARCFDENRTNPDLSFQSKDLYLTLLSGLYLAFCQAGVIWWN